MEQFEAKIRAFLTAADGDDSMQTLNNARLPTKQSNKYLPKGPQRKQKPPVLLFYCCERADIRLLFSPSGSSQLSFPPFFRLY